MSILPFAKDELRIVQELRSEVREISQPCYNPGCGELAIRSHILQRNRILSRIADDKGFIRQIEFNSLFSSNYVKFSKPQNIAGGDVLTFFGFCGKNGCDRKIFEEIEGREPEPTNYRHLILLSYRAHLNELYKQEYNIKWYNAILQRGLSPEVEVWAKSKKAEFEVKVKVSLEIKALFERELKNHSRECFTFHNRIVSDLPVATSAVWGGVMIKNDNAYLINYFIHLLPMQNGKTTVIIGHTKDIITSIEGYPVSVLNLIQEVDFKAIVSSILIKYVETWCISDLLYSKWKQDGIDKKIIELIQYHFPKEKKNIPVKLSIF